MEDQFFGMKELYQVVLRATDKGARIGERVVAPHEPVTYFEHVQVGALTETIRPVAARGGRGNDPLVIWEDRTDVTFKMQAGVLSDIGFGLLINAKFASKPDTLLLHCAETMTIDDFGKCAINNHKAIEGEPLFCFLYNNKVIQGRITPEEIDYETGIFTFDEQYCNQTVMIDYTYQHETNAQIYVLDRERFAGMFEIEGKFYRKGEEDGINRTTIFRMPQVRIVSGLSIILGEHAIPTVSSFNVVATPKKTNFSSYTVAEFFNLDGDAS